MNALPPMPVTPEMLEALPDGKRYELVHGHLTELPMGAYSGEVVVNIGTALKNHCRAHNLGRVYANDAGYRCHPEDATRVRKPDVSFVAEARLPDGRSPDGYFRIPPDLAVEVASPSDLLERIEAKAEEYLFCGVRLVWVVSPASQTAYIHRPDRSITVLRRDGTLTGEDVIPGFTCRIAELFE